ncbi:MAG: hypothetical protein KVP17_001971 [Porospora cf. gigantea B]|nr:MAG: hypothetical protein KVP17_001971 [Porospora cf. gigantea B]
MFSLKLFPDIRMIEEQEGAFTSRWAFWLTIAGCSVGFGNVWRFPYVVYNRGGLSFLIIYLLVLAICAIPTLVVEFGMGQMSRHGIAGAFSSTGSPRLRWVGIGGIVPAYMCVFYPLLVVWSFTYFVACFQKELPWGVRPEDVEMCAAFGKSAADCVAAKCFVHGTTGDCVPDYIGAANGFFETALNSYPNEQGVPTGFSWPCLGYLLLTYILMFLGVSMGPALMGKIMYITMTLPTLLLIILLGVGISLSDSAIGIKKYIVQIDSTTFGDLAAYKEAATQAVFSCTLGTGVLFTLGGHNPLRQNFITDAFVMTVADTVFAFVAGFVVFSVMGHLSGATGLDFATLPLSGSGLAFKSYPVGLTSLGYPWSNILTALFFMVLCLLGWDTLAAYTEGLTDTFLASQFNKTRANLGRKTICGIICSFLFVVNILLATDQGPHWLDTVDHYVSVLLLLALTWVENMLMSWFMNSDMCSLVVGNKVYWSAFAATVGLPAVGGVVMEVFFDSDTANGGGWCLLVIALTTTAGVLLTPLAATKDVRNGSPLTIADRYFYVYGANVVFFRDQVALLTQRHFWVGWMYIMKVPCTIFLTFVTWMSYGSRSTWVFSFVGEDGELLPYAMWMLVCALVLVLSTYALAALAFWKPSFMDLWVPDDVDPDLLTRDCGFGYLDPEWAVSSSEEKTVSSSYMSSSCSSS